MKLVHTLVPACIAVGLFAASAAPSLASKGFTLVYSFCQQANCADGEAPEAGLIADKSGNLYGTTTGGGAHGGGTVFEVTPTGSETVLYSFCSQANCTDGNFPLGGLVMDTFGNLYGTTHNGGARNAGTVFKLAQDGVETVLHSFCSHGGCRDGGYPAASLILARDRLYGTASFGGNKACSGGCGTVFRLTTGGAFKVLHAFQGGPADGANSIAELVRSNGIFYGTTANGGAFGNKGTVFSLTTRGVETVLYSFCSQANCADGATPWGLIADETGNLYGTTQYGGANSNSGTAFQVTPAGAETVLYSFCAQAHCADGATPFGPLLLSQSRHATALYGTTGNGGEGGTIFRLIAGTEKVLHSFNFTNGISAPGGTLVKVNGYLFGTANFGGNAGAGGVFKVGTDGS